MENTKIGVNGTNGTVCAYVHVLITKCTRIHGGQPRAHTKERDGFTNSAGENRSDMRQNCTLSPRYTSRRFQHSISTLLLLFSIIHLTYSSRAIFAELVVGVELSCAREGEVIEIGILKDNPCIQCICLNKTVKCKRMCEEPTEHPNENNALRQGCSYRNKYLNQSSQWRESRRRKPCERLYCQNGILTRAKLQCYTPCNNPVPPQNGQCCPSCQGCCYNGVIYEEGQSFGIPNMCVSCVCEKGSVRCTKDPCPVLSCNEEDYELGKGDCCQICGGNQTMEPKPPSGQCRTPMLRNKDTIESGETIKVDECTKCKCKNGTLLCDTQTCPIELACKFEEWVYSNTTCCPRCAADIPKNCVDSKGRMRKHEGIWSEGRDSCSLCTCMNGTVTCERNTCNEIVTCGEGKVPEFVPGKCCRQCVEAPGVCSVFGDPHYRTFDGRPFNYQGDCRYVMARDCLKENFSIEVQNDAKTSRSFSWTKSVHVTMMRKGSNRTTQLSLHQNFLTKISGRKVSLPYFTRNLVIFVERYVVKVRTKIGISLNWDGDSFLEIGASSAYKRKLCGLCGNYNGFARDDFIGQDGAFKFDAQTFAESWKVENGKCTRREYSPGPAEPCGRNLLAKLGARKACSIFKSSEFAICYSKIDPTEYYNDCLTDVCECQSGSNCACESILAYTSACERQGALVRWNRAIYCGKTCARGKVYSPCGPTCRRTCRNYKRIGSRTCYNGCAAGCHCPAGYVIHRKKCIRISQCESALREARLRSNARHRSINQRTRNLFRRP